MRASGERASGGGSCQVHGADEVLFLFSAVCEMGFDVTWLMSRELLSQIFVGRSLYKPSRSETMLPHADESRITPCTAGPIVR